MQTLYQFMDRVGFHHPLHPALTHLPVGLIMAAFIFALMDMVLHKSTLAQTSRHCLLLAIAVLPATALLGYFDWKTRIGGAMLFPIKMKLLLLPALFALLIAAALTGREEMVHSIKYKALLTLSFLVVVAIGFFGGELVFGAGKALSRQNTASTFSLPDGRDLFRQKCSMCHLTDSETTKIGPGLKGLFQRKKMPTSGKPVSGATVARQLRKPYRDMPAFTGFSDQEIEALIDYLKTL
jgi:uncharacterized membrane protein